MEERKRTRTRKAEGGLSSGKSREVRGSGIRVDGEFDGDRAAGLGVGGLDGFRVGGDGEGSPEGERSSEEDVGYSCVADGSDCGDEYFHFVLQECARFRSGPRGGSGYAALIATVGVWARMSSSNTLR